MVESHSSLELQFHDSKLLHIRLLVYCSYRSPCQCLSSSTFLSFWAVGVWHLLVDPCHLQVSGYIVGYFMSIVQIVLFPWQILHPALAVHCSASVSLSFFVFEKWECWTYWVIFAICRLVCFYVCMHVLAFGEQSDINLMHVSTVALLSMILPASLSLFVCVSL